MMFEIHIHFDGVTDDVRRHASVEIRQFLSERNVANRKNETSNVLPMCQDKCSRIVVYDIKFKYWICT